MPRSPLKPFQWSCKRLSSRERKKEKMKKKNNNSVTLWQVPWNGNHFSSCDKALQLLDAVIMTAANEEARSRRGGAAESESAGARGQMMHIAT